MSTAEKNLNKMKYSVTSHKTVF